MGIFSSSARLLLFLLISLYLICASLKAPDWVFGSGSFLSSTLHTLASIFTNFCHAGEGVVPAVGNEAAFFKKAVLSNLYAVFLFAGDLCNIFGRKFFKERLGLKSTLYP